MNATIIFTLYAGHRDFDVDVTFNRNVEEYDFSTGIINVKNSVELTDGKGLRGCWGTDWPAGTKDTINWKRETVGLGIYVPDEYRKHEIPANKDNYAYVTAYVGSDAEFSADRKGSVFKVNLDTYKIEGETQGGDQPEEIAIIGN